jgi:hypothetical protein
MDNCSQEMRHAAQTAAGDERGSAILYYVMIIFAILAIASPLLLRNAGESQTYNIAAQNEKIAYAMAAGGIESFISHLNQVPAGLTTTEQRLAYVNQFFEQTPPIQYTTPEGIPVIYSIAKSGPTSDGKLTVTSKAVAGSGRMKRSKELVYEIDAAVNGGSGGTYITLDPNERLPSTESKIYVGGTHNISNRPVTEVSDLPAAIGTAIDTLSQTYRQEVSHYEAMAVTCVCSTNAAIQSAINSSSQNPVVLHITGDLSTGQNFNPTWGNASKPVVLIFDHLFLSKGGNVTIYGSLFVKGDLDADSSSGNFGLNVYRVNGQFGDLYVLGKLESKNNNNLSISDTFFAGSFSAQNTLNLHASTAVIEDTVNIHNNMNLTVDQNLLAGNVHVHTNGNVTVRAGDFLVEQDLISGNNMNINTGGSIGVGGNLNAGNGSSFNTGNGGTTAVIVGDPSSGGGGGGSQPAGAWNPVRK